MSLSLSLLSLFSLRFMSLPHEIPQMVYWRTSGSTGYVLGTCWVWICTVIGVFGDFETASSAPFPHKISLIYHTTVTFVLGDGISLFR